MSPSPLGDAGGVLQEWAGPSLAESTSRPQTVAERVERIVRCRHLKQAGVDVATRVNVHMP